jgi:hypothetical protein
MAGRHQTSQRGNVPRRVALHGLIVVRVLCFEETYT